MSKTIFLLGAGASKDAGLPLMADLTTHFRDWVSTWKRVKDPDTDLRLFDAAMNAVSTGAPPNIEHVLSLLESVSSSRRGAAAKTVAKWQPPFDEPEEHLTRLASDVRKYIGDTLRGVDPKAAQYLSGLLDFHDSDEPVDVFTMNYDRLVESMAARLGVRFTTGFGDVWDPGLFTVGTRWDMRVFKLHGSIDWYRLPSRSLVFQGSPEHFAFPGEQTVEVLLYPAEGKEAYADPYATLMAFFTQALSQAEVCVSVGYSFRDAHIRRTVLDRMATNPSLQLLVVNPTAGDVIDLPPDEEGEPSFTDFPDRVIGSWFGAKQAFEDRLIRHRLNEIVEADIALRDVVTQRSRRDFNGAAWQLLEAVERCRETQLSSKPVRLLAEIAGAEFRTSMALGIRQASNFLARAFNQVPPYPFPNDSERQLHVVRGTLQEYFGRLVSLWLMATWLSPTDQANKIRGLVTAALMLYGVRGLLILEEDRYLSWPTRGEPTLPDPGVLVRDRADTLRNFENELHDHPPTATLALADDSTIRQYEALKQGVTALKNLYEVLSIKTPRRILLASDQVAIVPLSGSEWRVMALNPLGSSSLGQLFAALEESQLVAMWFSSPELSGKREALVGL